MLNRVLFFFCHSLWFLFSLKDYLFLQIGLFFPGIHQKRYLQRLLKKQEMTDYGQALSFNSIRNYEEYIENVPVTTYEAYQSAIDKMADGKKDVLTADEILLFELSSGSTSASKLIPYTKGVKAEFQKGISAWMVDLYLHLRPLWMGSSYWSITPVSQQKQYTKGGIPIGFEEDSEYFGGFAKRLVDRLMCVPKEVASIEEIDAFHYVTLLFLVRDKHLTLISVWNPTFLFLLLDKLELYWHQLLKDIEEGTLTPPTKLEEELYGKLKRKANRKRAFELKDIKPTEYKKIWKNLTLISCWGDGNAATYYKRLQEKIPGVPIQKKGLLATEGFISLPLWNENGSVLAINSHFFEFIKEESGEIKQVTELEVGKRYSLMLTTGGGLYRYRLYDRIQVVGIKYRTPLLIFIGKEKKIVDHFGEKVNEAHVTELLGELFQAYGFHPEFHLLAYDSIETKGYTLYVKGKKSIPNLSCFIEELDERLKENYHYRYCRYLGQLQKPSVFYIQDQAIETYLEVLKKEGQKLGDIKPSSLNGFDQWSRYFKRLSQKVHKTFWDNL